MIAVGDASSADPAAGSELDQDRVRAGRRRVSAIGDDDDRADGSEPTEDVQDRGSRAAIGARPRSRSTGGSRCAPRTSATTREDVGARLPSALATGAGVPPLGASAPGTRSRPRRQRTRTSRPSRSPRCRPLSASTVPVTCSAYSPGLGGHDVGAVDARLLREQRPHRGHVAERDRDREVRTGVDHGLAVTVEHGELGRVRERGEGRLVPPSEAHRQVADRLVHVRAARGAAKVVGDDHRSRESRRSCASSDGVYELLQVGRARQPPRRPSHRRECRCDRVDTCRTGVRLVLTCPVCPSTFAGSRCWKASGLVVVGTTGRGGRQCGGDATAAGVRGSVDSGEHDRSPRPPTSQW